MGESTRLERFIAALPGPARARAAEAGEELERALGQALAAARTDWPELALDEGAFAGYLAERLEPDQPPLQGLRRLRVTDLFLAFACARGDTRAMTACESQHFPTVDAALARLRLSPTMIEEVKQTLREQLFVAGPPDGTPMIARFSGRGQLRRWLKIIAVRTAGKLIDQGKREVLLTNSVLHGMAPAGDDLELDYLKRTYRGEFKRAFSEAMQSLTPRERNLLGHHFVDRLSIDEIGVIYSVHRATAARWLVKARAALLERTRERLMGRIKVDQDEYESIMRLIESQLVVSLPALPDPK